MEGNGQNDHESGLNRLEEWFGCMQENHEEFEKEHKRLLIAQVVMQDKLEKTQYLVHEIGEKMNGLIAWSDQVHRDKTEGFKRLEERQ